MRTRLVVLALAVAPACGGGGSDDGAKAKLASDLVTCKNEKSQLKEQLAEAKGELEKAKQQLADNGTVKLDPIQLQARKGERHMDGNVAPDAVVKVLKQNSGGLRACYEHAL